MDKLKSVLGTKCHMNNFLLSIPFIPAKEIKNVVFPIVQIMGFDVRLYTLQLVNRGVYILQDLASFSFPTNYNSLKHSRSKIINGLSCIESLLIELKNMYETYQMDDDDDMSRILSGTSKKKNTPINSWTTEVIWNEKDDGDLEEESNSVDNDDDDDDDL